jgi:hypothetical protein
MRSALIPARRSLIVILAIMLALLPNAPTTGGGTTGAAWAANAGPNAEPPDPESCPPGEEPSGDGCQPCPSGEYKTASDLSACIDAPPGTYVTDPTQAPTSCPAGTYNLTYEASSVDACIKARRGHFAPSTTAADRPCVKGTYADVEGLAACKPAAIGFYVPTDGATAQLACPTAKVTGSTTCPAAATTPAPAPTPTPTPAPAPAPTEPLDGPAAGDPCPAGSWSATGTIPFGGVCTPASPGSFVADEGSTAQEPCPPGSYSATFGADECTLASVGSYVPTSGATAQSPCPAATSPGASTCGAAPAIGGVPDWSRFPSTLVLSQVGPLRRGDVVSVLGTGFAPSSSVVLWVSTFDEPAGSATTDASGVMRVDLELPRRMGTGEVVIIAIDATGAGQTATVEVTRSWVGLLLGALGVLVVLLAGFVAWRRAVVRRRRRSASARQAGRDDGPAGPPRGAPRWDDGPATVAMAAPDAAVRVIEPPLGRPTGPASEGSWDPAFDDGFDDRS